MPHQNVELIPDAQILLSSLRSVGYKVETAVADIIDNCIGAHATEIHIDFNWDGENSVIAIYDNGEGMDKNSLISSMKLGSLDPAMKREADDLGRFGMGLKTAAFSMGKRLRVITKQNGVYSTACWDLDYITSLNDGKWILLIDDIDCKSTLQNYPKFKANQDGTIILIENLDRLIDCSQIKKSKNSFYRIIEKVKAHISMIFHRFIEEDDLAIYFKDEIIKAWNPFILHNNATQELSEEEYFDGTRYVLVQPYVLPHKTKFLSEDEFKKAAGYKGWNAHQGIYVYRNRRLLVYGTWFDFLKKEPAFNLARIRLDMSSVDDYDWKIDIKKSIAIPPLYMRDILQRVITVCTAQSAKVYNSRGSYSKKSGSQQLSFVWEQRKNRFGTYMFYLNRKHPMLNNIFRQLDNNTKKDLRAYLSLVESYAPVMQSGLTTYLSDQIKVDIAENDQGKLADIKEAKEYIKKFFDNGFSKDEIEDVILNMPNYKYIQDELIKVFEENNYD